MRIFPLIGVLLAVGIAGCGPGGDAPLEILETTRARVEAEDAEDVLRLVNDPNTGFELLDVDIGLDRRAAVRILERRPFASIAALDAVPYVGPVALRKLSAYAAANPVPEIPDAPDDPDPPVEQDGERYSQTVLAEIVRTFEIEDPELVVRRARALGDGNGYANRTELEAAARSIANDQATTSGFRYSDRILSGVVTRASVSDPLDLIARGTLFDAGNSYLSRSELESAANRMSDPTFGIISDLDKTIVPPDSDALSADAYPGVVALFRALGGPLAYVTARTPDRVEQMPRWLGAHNLAPGPIDTGVSAVPWAAQAEKIRDVSALIESAPGRTFVLFGDSSHRDPEVYRHIVATFPDRILLAFIHRVNNVNPTRVEGLALFENYAEAAAIAFEHGFFDENVARAVIASATAEGLELTAEDVEALIDAHRP